MTDPDLLKTARNVERQISQAQGAQRLALQPQLSGILERMKLSGQTVPVNLCDLDATLRNEAIESQFDNMPV